MSNINWKGGFLRIWILLSIIWLLVVLFFGSSSVFYTVPSDNDAKEAYLQLMDSYNCTVRNQSNPRLNLILKKFSNDIILNIHKISNILKPPSEMERLTEKKEILKEVIRRLELGNNLGITKKEASLYLQETNLELEEFMFEKTKFVRNASCKIILHCIPYKKLSNKTTSYVDILMSGKVTKENFTLAIKEGGNCQYDIDFILNFRGEDYKFCPVENGAYNPIESVVKKISNKRIENIKTIFLIWFVPSFILFAMGAIILWIISGFKTDK